MTPAVKSGIGVVQANPPNAPAWRLHWRTSDNVWTLTTEVFGQLGEADTRSLVQPRFQVGLRWRPIDRFSMDLILGRNITGENANWITLATSIRFPAEGKKAGE